MPNTNPIAGINVPIAHTRPSEAASSASTLTRPSMSTSMTMSIIAPSCAMVDGNASASSRRTWLATGFGRSGSAPVSIASVGGGAAMAAYLRNYHRAAVRAPRSLPPLLAAAVLAASALAVAPAALVLRDRGVAQLENEQPAPAEATFRQLLKV